MKGIVTRRICLHIFLLAAVLWVSMAQGDWDVTRLTNNGYQDEKPRLFDGKACWQGQVDTWQIFYWDGSTIQQITSESGVPSTNPCLSAENIVFERGQYSGMDIYAYNIAGGSTTRLSSSEQQDLSPMVYGSKASWMGWDGLDFEIFLYEFGAGETKLTDNDYDDLEPEIWLDELVWQAANGVDTEIVYYDGFEPVILTQNRLPDTNVVIRDGLVVWEQGVDADKEIWLYDGEIHQITANNRIDANPDTQGGVIVWQGSDTMDLEIYYLDYLGGGSITQVTYNNYGDIEPRIHEGKVAWMGEVIALKHDIFTWYDGIPDRVTDDDKADQFPDIYDEELVWQKEGEIYRAVFTGPAPSPTAWPSFTPTVSPTGAPVTPTETPLPPTNTPTPTPVLTATPSCDLGVELRMPAVNFRPSDPCYLYAYVCNSSGSAMPGTPVFVFLDIGINEYWFAPGWKHYPPEIDFYTENLEPGETFIEVISLFSWPAGAGSYSGVTFWGAMTDVAITSVIGEIGSWTFSYGS